MVVVIVCGIYIYIPTHPLYYSYIWGSLRLAPTSECKALWGEPEPAPFFVCAYAFALIGTRDAVHLRM